MNLSFNQPIRQAVSATLDEYINSCQLISQALGISQVLLNKENQIVDVVNFRTRTTIIPADALLMAGGEGKRLRPLTEHTPKPLLKVGEKPIIEYNIDRLAQVGIKNIHLSINYLGEQLENYFGNGSAKNLNIKYIKEKRPEENCNDPAGRTDSD